MTFIVSVWAFFILCLFTWPAIMVLILLGIVLEANDRYILPVFVTAGVFCIIWQMLAFTFSIPYIWVTFLIYPILGFAYAPFRWIHYCNRQVRKNNKLPITTKEIVDRHGNNWKNSEFRKTTEEMARDIDFKKHLDRIACWALAWPLSAVECFIGDVYRGVQLFITTVCSRIYRGIETRALRLVEYPVDEDDTKTKGDTGC